MRDFTSELFRGEIARPLHPRPHGRAALVAAGPCAGPCAGPAWTSRAEGGAGTSRADALLVWGCGISLRNCSDVKSRVPYTLDHTGGPRLSRPGPVPGPAWTSRAEGGAGTSRADAPLVWGCGISLRNCSDVKSRVPYTLGHTGGPRLSRPGPAPPSTNTPPTAKSTASPPTAWRAKYPRRPRRVASERASHVGWPWRTMAPTLVGARVPRARSAPHARARLGCRTSRRVRAGGGPPGTSAPTILPPAPTRPRRWPHNGPAREVPAPPPARGVRTPPARSDGRDGRDAIQCVRTHRRAAARDDTAVREVDSHPSAHMGRKA